jgi:hypothetical protein
MLLSPGKSSLGISHLVNNAHPFLITLIGSTPNNLKSNSGIWSKFKRKPNEWEAGGPSQQGPPPMMGMMGGPMMGGGAVMRQRFLTLVHGEMETIKLMPNSYAVRLTITKFSNDYAYSLLRKLKEWQGNGSDHPLRPVSISGSLSNTLPYKPRCVSRDKHDSLVINVLPASDSWSMALGMYSFGPQRTKASLIRSHADFFRGNIPNSCARCTWTSY